MRYRTFPSSLLPLLCCYYTASCNSERGFVRAAGRCIYKRRNGACIRHDRAPKTAFKAHNLAVAAACERAAGLRSREAAREREVSPRRARVYHMRSVKLRGRERANKGIKERACATAKQNNELPNLVSASLRQSTSFSISLFRFGLPLLLLYIYWAVRIRELTILRLADYSVDRPFIRAVCVHTFNEVNGNGGNVCVWLFVLRWIIEMPVNIVNKSNIANVISTY